ncbi:MAG TPA: DUF6644 family protein [Hyphomicrobiaceae bacterium]|nr:DUF6644 family protein [Hyphomicrobiaceae bacterium]
MIPHDAPHVLTALEQSGLAAAIRQSVWAYPAANVGHIVALTLFAGSLAIMDARLIGAFAATPPADVVRPARRVAVLGLLLMLLTGSVLFAAEAGHVGTNPLFQLKVALIVLGLCNAFLTGRAVRPLLDSLPAFAPLPRRVRLSAFFSLGIWVCVAACGRLIAYF